MRWNRRKFLQGLGYTGGALGMSGLGMLGRLGRAAEGEAPKRLLVISHCHGWAYDGWKMRPSGTSESTPWDIALTHLSAKEMSEPLAPLHRHRNRMLAVDGLSLATAELDMDGNRHDTGWVNAWTGNWADFSGTDTRSNSASIDQLVAEHIARTDRLPSIELSVDSNLEGGRPISYAANGARLPVANTPMLAWQRLFGLTSNPDPLVLRQRDVLDFAHAEYTALRSRLGTEQQQRLDAHYDLLHNLGERIEGLANLTCGDMPSAPETPLSYDANFDAFAELIAAGFACDITRVASLSLGEMPTADFGADHITDDVHKGIAHLIYDNPTLHQAMVDYLTVHAGQVARLVDLLEATPDVDGRSVMDNTLILWSSELGDGWHGYQHWCPVILGGSWHFRTGRYVYMPHETPIQLLVPPSIDPSGYVTTSGRPHQHILVSVAQAMGMDVDQIGIDAVQGQTGEWVDCRGPLLELV